MHARTRTRTLASTRPRRTYAYTSTRTHTHAHTCSRLKCFLPYYLPVLPGFANHIVHCVLYFSSRIRCSIPYHIRIPVSFAFPAIILVAYCYLNSFAPYVSISCDRRPGLGGEINPGKGGFYPEGVFPGVFRISKTPDFPGVPQIPALRQSICTSDAGSRRKKKTK